jgi:hypothetical protein
MESNQLPSYALYLALSIATCLGVLVVQVVVLFVLKYEVRHGETCGRQAACSASTLEERGPQITLLNQDTSLYGSTHSVQNSQEHLALKSWSSGD